ncbi:MULTISPECIES: hypothetical protein [Rodentibacter]|uniref:Uncharacterized protein n=2 Tax=Rodentibacter TaxID=1960084 RepID=A0A1V3JJX2_9PAST|nr:MULTISPECIES: hypothetical protein [Rodentibacter]OOF35859.1 hypothetical protein BKK47_11945 [Rodentibacter mrazii]OOF56707.1 hypothetical protein BKK56_02350 [Rodentibacter genomosp. 2]OOF57961.1 hypothetical protein BKK55_03195 [Rodentibacter genomosp. 2]
MKITCAVMLYFGLCYLSMNAFAGNDELVPRKGLGPLDRAKVNQVQAQKWSRIGIGMEMGGDAQDSVSQYGNSSSVGSSSLSRTRNCSTNIGNVTTQKGVSSGRYGPKNNNVVVVKGDVINVCK